MLSHRCAPPRPQREARRAREDEGGVLIFTGYILYDTDQIINKVQLEDCDTGTAIWGAVELYLDIVNLFLHILALLANDR